ncbi:hypothetical protein TWF696_006690 [Orbilia brochopaga]|uniref:F-box domain-containing protein n=1 Tax=Orbilia brochopaga TaxID=3140254 RepID=A0AAV9UPL8_9PEZI
MSLQDASPLRTPRLQPGVGRCGYRPPPYVYPTSTGTRTGSSISFSQALLEWIFHEPDPPARTVASYLNIEDINNLRNTCRLHRSYICDGGKWAWMLNRVSVPARQAPYLTTNPRIQKLLLGAPPQTRDGYIAGRPIVVLDVSARDRARDLLNLARIFNSLNSWDYVTLLILDGTRIDAGDIGHLLKDLQNVSSLSIRHCWNVDLQLLYQLFKKTPKEHIDQVNFYNHSTQKRIFSKSPAAQIKRLRIWDIDGLQDLTDERGDNGRRLVSQISARFFMRNFDVDIRKCEKKVSGYSDRARHSVFMVCVGQTVRCLYCDTYIWIEACPKCRLQSSCEICGKDDYLCAQCSSGIAINGEYFQPSLHVRDLLQMRRTPGNSGTKVAG